MDQSDFNTVRNTAASVKSSRTNSWFLTVLLVCLLGNSFVAKAAIITSTSTGGSWSAATTWVGNVVPSPNDDVTVVNGSTIVLDVNLTIGSGTYTFNGNVTDNGNHTLTAITNNGKLIISNNSTTTIGGIVSLDNSTITVNVGSTLVTGAINIGNGTAITITGSLFVNGNLTDNNNGGPGSFLSVTGYVQVYGNYIAPVGGVSVSGEGVFQTTGTIITIGGSTVGDSTNNCTNGPCSSGSISCGDGTNSYFSSVSPTNQVLCSGQTITPISFVTNATGTLTYKWQKSTTNGGTGFSDVLPAQTNSTYTPPQPSQTTWYRMVYSSTTTGCSGLISPSSKISLNNNTPPTTANAGSDQINCNTSTFTLAGNAAAEGTGTWTVVSGAATITTPNSNTSAVSGITAGTSATLRWTISNGTCNTSTDDVILTNNALPTAYTVTGTGSYCSGGTGVAVGLANSTTGVNYQLQLGGVNTGTAVAGTTGAAISFGLQTAAGTYTVMATNATTTCTLAMTGSAIITINPTPAAPTITTTQPSCSIATGTITVTAPSPGTGISYSIDGSTYTNTTGTFTSVPSATYSVTTKNSSGCISPSTALTVNAQPATPSAPTASVSAQPTCAVSTGTITVTVPSPGTGISYSIDGLTYTNSTGIFTLVSSGTYSVTTKNSSGCISPAASPPVVLNPFVLVDNIWNGTAAGWSTGFEPTADQQIVFAADYDSIGDLNACSCKVNSGKTVTINPSHTLTLTNAVTVLGTGTLTFKSEEKTSTNNSASLIQTKDVTTNTNSGNITYERMTTPIRSDDYTYWSSPVAAYSLGAVATSQYYLSYDSAITNNWKWETASTQMDQGVGYAIQGPTTNRGEPFKALFTGVPNNGDITVPIVYTNPSNYLPDNPDFGVSYLLGNPYPSAIDADAFLIENAGVAGVLGGTLYFWTHSTPPQAADINNLTLGSGAYAYTSNDYASYNITGGVGIGIVIDPTGPGGLIPNSSIASGQGFFATGIKTGTVTFKNSMRLGKSGAKLDNSQFFRTSSTAKSKTASALEKHRIWLDLKNSQGAFKQTLVGYISGATNDYDNLFDGASYDGNDFVDFYSINQDKNLTIQGRALPFDENDTVPLGFKTTIAGSFTINIGQVDGLLTNQAVYLEDKVTNTVTNLKTGDYTFTTEVGTFDDRFVLRYTDKTLGLNETDQADGILVFYSNNYKTLIIKNNVMDATVNSVALFNTTGQRIANFDIKDSGQTNLQIPIKNIPSGIYIVKVKTTKGESSKKVIVN